MNHNKEPQQRTMIDEPDVIEMLDELDNLEAAGRRAGIDDKKGQDPKGVGKRAAERYLSKKALESKKVRQSRVGAMVAGATLVAASAGLALSGSGAETNTTDNKQDTATEQVDDTARETLGSDDSVLADLDMNIDRDGIQTDGRDLEAELNQKQGPANQ